MNKRALIGGLVILVIMGLAMWQGMGGGKNWNRVPLPTPKIALTLPSPAAKKVIELELLDNAKYGYSIMKPKGWDVATVSSDKNFDDRQVFSPIDKSSSKIAEISVTVVGKIGKVLDLSSQGEWNRWMASPVGATDSSGLVKKIGEKMVSGNRAVVLMQNEDLPEGFDWSIMTWYRKGTTNYYIDALGAGQVGEGDTNLFDQIAGSLIVK